MGVLESFYYKSVGCFWWWKVDVQLDLLHFFIPFTICLCRGIVGLWLILQCLLWMLQCSLDDGMVLSGVRRASCIGEGLLEEMWVDFIVLHRTINNGWLRRDYTRTWYNIISQWSETETLPLWQWHLQIALEETRNRLPHSPPPPSFSLGCSCLLTSFYSFFLSSRTYNIFMFLFYPS